MFVEEALRREGLDVELAFGMVLGTWHGKTGIVVSIQKVKPAEVDKPWRGYWDANQHVVAAKIQGYKMNRRPGPLFVPDP